MKRLIIIAAVIAAFFAPASARADDISITVNGTELVTDNAPVITDGRTLVPMRAIFEALGARVTWNGEERCAYASKGGRAIRLPIGSDVMGTGIVNSGNAMLFSSEIKLDVSARLIDDFTYVPARAVAEAFNSKVDWIEGERRVVITDIPEGDKAFFYASADDYNKLYRVDSNGAVRRKLSDKEVKSVYYDSGFVYYVASDGFLYRQSENGGAEEQITDYDTEVVGIESGRIFCLNKTAEHKGELREHGVNTQSFGYVMYPQIHRSYIYYNRENDTRMYAMNLETYAETSAEMSGGLTLSPFNCVFYNDYILVEDGYGYQNIFRFDADCSNMIKLNRNNSYICRNQEEDPRVLYVNGDHGQDIYYVWIDGSYNGMVVDMPDDCAWADVLCQDGSYIYYKNMYRKEIYRTDFDASENIYVGYGDTAGVYGDSLLIADSVLYRCGLDGSGMTEVYGREVSDYFARNDDIYAVDKEYGNIVKISGADTSYITNDYVTVWTDNMDEEV